MKWAEISILTTHEAAETVANIFHELGSSGVVIEDPELVNSYLASGVWDYSDILQESNTEVVTVKAYLPVDHQLDDKLRSFEEEFQQISSRGMDKGRGEMQCREVQEEDWASSWKAFFHPIKVGQYIVIKPSWEEYVATANDLVIELDPGMAFGTGTHQTTAMCCRALEETVKAGDLIFDVGTGSGILSIAAAKLGAASVQAVDLDHGAVRVAKENVAINQVENIVQVGQGDLLTGVTGQADIVIANIIADVVIKLLVDIPVRLKDEGIFIASGIIAERLSDVAAAMIEYNLIVEKVIEEGGWVAIIARKGGR
ncbi:MULTISPECIES: 50S ribosomal protein L11 methyltransferase [Pelosinus]|uniref:Ribosomal protein L11 methyltransferase n=2 Tax=Pelosinus TaxID=365348 RepID=I8TZ69_9FIRM|nr:MULTISPECIES: 50S ribosomal protein L11 methyltransferase [Pelosinus]AJQ27224.1 Ribosomal protein L11 methyltransferase [Pelosinus fermentans JBW45]MCC5466402.1 50S ribosomal protein L11 methyltransferase [Pelosinus baikalensis]